MTDKRQPAALRLAISIDLMDTFTDYQQEELDKAAAELRRQYERIAELEAELEAVGAGGVQALSSAPAGWKLVPVEPTDEMLKAADDGDDEYTLRNFGPGVQRVMQGPYDHYCAMLAASPTPPAEQPPRWVERWHGSGGKEFWEGWSILNATNREMIAHLGPDVDPDAVRDIVAAHNEALCGECAGTGGRWCPACAGATPPAEQQATSDPLDWPLPCDITVGGVTNGKGCPLRTVQTRLEVQAEANALLMRHLRREQAAPKAAPGEPYQDSTPHLSVGDSSFEGWYESYCPAHKADKQRARDAYAAGMGDPLVRAAPQQEAREPVSPRHPVVIQWRDNAIEACAKIADAYGHEHAAQDMRAMLTAHQQEAQEPWGYARKSPGCGWYLCSKRHHEEAVADGFETKKLYTAPQPAPAPLSRDQIREVFMAHGFTIKEGQTDLKQYVYDAAHALLELVAAPQQAAQEPTEVPYQKLTNEIDLILSDPDTALSIGAKRALLWMRTWVSVPLYTAPQPAPAPLIARSLAEWHEDDGCVAWWAWNGREWAGEPAWIGTPNCEDWPGYHTHWTPHPEQPVCAALAAQGGKA